MENLSYFYKQSSKFIINNQSSSFISKYIYTKTLFSRFFSFSETILPLLKASLLNLSQGITGFLTLTSHFLIIVNIYNIEEYKLSTYILTTPCNGSV